MEWVRLYTDILDDEKFTRVSDFSYKIFTFLLLLCRERETEGIIDMDFKGLSWRFRLSELKIKRAIDELISIGVLSCNKPLLITKWESRQYKTDDANERMKRYRERNKDRNTKKICSAVEQKQNRTETETDRGGEPQCAHVKALLFVKPTLEEVDAYCRKSGNNINPKVWIDHYTSNGWMVGKNKMKDWQAAVRTWEMRNSEGTQKAKGLVRV